MGANEPRPVRTTQVWGYVPNYDRAAAWSAAQAHRNVLSGVALFQYHLDANGAVVEYPALDGPPAWVLARGLPVVPMIANLLDGQWRRDVAAGVLRHAVRRRRHVEEIVNLVVGGDHPGVELDYESLSAAEREPFSSFVDELVRPLHEWGKQLSLAVHAKLAEPGEWGGAQAQDWSTIGAAVDRVVVMTYDHDPSRPGAIAPIEWTRAVLRLAVSRIAPTKVIQGIPFYGYDWSGTSPPSYCTHSELADLAHRSGVEPLRDPTDQHLVLQYVEAGVRHQVWLPDAVTVAALATVGRDVGVAGYAVWRLGGEDPSVWRALERVIR